MCTSVLYLHMHEYMKQSSIQISITCKNVFLSTILFVGKLQKIGQLHTNVTVKNYSYMGLKWNKDNMMEGTLQTFARMHINVAWYNY